MAISFRRVPMRLAAAVIATVYLLPAPSTRLLSLQALAAETTSFTDRCHRAPKPTPPSRPLRWIDPMAPSGWLGRPAARMSPVPTTGCTPS